MSESSRSVPCPMCGIAANVPDGADRITCGICSSVIVFENGEPILESDLERKKRNEPAGVTTKPDATNDQQQIVTAPGLPVVDSVDDGPTVLTATAPIPDFSDGPTTKTDTRAPSTEISGTPLPESAEDRLFDQQTVADAPMPPVPPADEGDVTAPHEMTSVKGSVLPYAGDGLAEGLDTTRVDTRVPDLSPLDAPAFRGSLKDLSIVDVLQLLYSSQKTGVLHFQGPASKGSITLLEGHIIGCEHPTEDAQIGKTLVESGAVTQADVDAALAEQQTAGENRLPLVSTLIAMGKIDQQAGWQALEKLVESTVVHVINNCGEGTFVFEVADVTAYDDFRHLPEGVSTRVGLDTQTALLGALKAMDEHEDGEDLDTTLLDAAFSEVGPEEVADDSFVEIGEISEDAPTDTHPAPGLGDRLRRLPRGPLIAVAGATVLVIVVVIIALASGDDEETPTETVTGGTEATEPADPAEPDAAKPDAPEPEPVVDEPVVDEPAAQPVVSAPATTKVKKKTKRKRRRKSKDARSLFDAAVK